MSGGLDSTHALIVAARAMDRMGRPRSDILAYTMPGFATSDHTKNNATELSQRLTRIFLRDAEGCRPVFGGRALFNHDPHWREVVPFHEYFHGDTGAGIGASHQTGWTALVATHLDELVRHA